MNFVISLLVLTLLLTSAESLRILGIFAHPGRSHFDVFKPLLETLSERGHEVTVVSYFPSEKKLPRYKDIVLKYPGTDLSHSLKMEIIRGTRDEKYFGANMINQFGKLSCEVSLPSKQFQDLLKSDQKFDVILSEYFNSNCLLTPLVEKLKIPFIGITSHVAMPWSNTWVGNPDNPAYIPIIFMGFSDKMSFFERVDNTLSWLYNRIYYSYVVESNEEALLKEHIGINVTHADEVMHNTSLLLLNSHFSLNRPRPLPPNVVEVGGIHIGKNKKLPGRKGARSLCGELLPLREEIATVQGYPGTDLSHIFKMEHIRGTRDEKYFGANMINQFGKLSCEVALPSIQFQDLLKSDEKFDVILSEYFNSNCLLTPLVEKLKIPFIGITSHVVMPWSNTWVGNPDNPAYIPVTFMDFSDNMSFFERVDNTLSWLYNKMYYSYVVESNEEALLKKHIGINVTHADEVMHNTSLLLLNSHFSLNRPRPLPPNVVEVGGIHLGKNKKLPGNIEKWINESSQGVIYFSLGSMIKGHTFPEEKRQMFLRAFGRLPQRVLWKWETETMPGKPDNVMLQKWMPQFDILSHPNVKAFISHGGLLGTTEAVHCGVPMVVVPQFGDQFTNAKAVEASGGGVILDFRYLDEESIYNALSTILEPSFNKKAKELSARFHDRPLPPLDTAIYWVEYVARHGGAPHLRTAAVGMPLYKYLLLDVVAFLAVTLIIITYISYLATRAILRRIFNSKSDPKVKKS